MCTTMRPYFGLQLSRFFIALSLILSACGDTETTELDTSDLNLDATEEELEAIFGGADNPTSQTPASDDMPQEPAASDDKPEESAAPDTYNKGPQSLFDSTEEALTENNIPKDMPDGLFYSRSNNTALLNGPVLGTGEIQNSDIRRIIPYTLQRYADGLELLAVYLLKGNNTSILDSDLAVGIVRNRSSRTQCYIKASGITLLDEQGNPSSDYIADQTFVVGADGTDSPWRDIPDSSACLGVGDVGYFRAAFNAIPDSVGGIAIELLSYLDREWVIPTPRMIPITYAVSDSNLSVRVVNHSTVRLELASMVSVFLDEKGLPLGFHHWIPWPDESLAAGQEKEFEFDVDFRGSVSSIRFLLSLEEGDWDGS